MKTSSKKILGWILSILLLLIFSCGEDTGLGASVDTQTPTLAITYPESAAEIRDSFVLYGTCSDDKVVSKVTVGVRSLEKSSGETGYVNESFLADISSDGSSWSLTLNDYDSENPDYFNGWRYADGKYEVTVTAYDAAGHDSNGSSRQFEIDNTPPVFIISNPGVVKSDGLAASAYGSIFTIDGTISDNHTISFMDVKIYDSTGVLVSSETYEGDEIDFYREEEIATAGGSSVTIAQYQTDTTSAATTANKRYYQLHPSDSGTEYYYAAITLRDSTMAYKNPTGEERTGDEAASDELGNPTSSLYLYDDVYKTLMSKKKGLGLSAANLKDILAGIETNDEALSVLKENVKDTSESEDNRLYFSLNPEANPTYQVNGYEFGFGEDDVVQTASTGNTVSVTVSAGLDNTNIEPEVVKLWMKAYSSKPSDFDSVENDISSLVAGVKAAEGDDSYEFEEDTTTIADWVLIYDYSVHNDKGSSVSTKTFSVTLPDGITLDKYYVLALTGYDIEDVVFAQDTVYGFEGNTAGVAPTVVITSPKSLSISGQASSLKFTGSATLSTSSLFVSELSATISVTDEDSGESVGTTDPETIYRDNSDDDWSESDALYWAWDADGNSYWTFEPGKLSSFIDTPSSSQYLYTLTFSAKSSSGHSNDTTLSVHVDTTYPAVTISSITPSVSGSEYFGEESEDKDRTFFNGSIKIKGSVEEQNLADNGVTYDIWASTDLEKVLSESDSILSRLNALDSSITGILGKVYTINFTLDTRLISKIFATDPDSDPKVKLEFVFYAEDSAGNKTTFYSTESAALNEDSNIFAVYQETDRPVITLGNADSEITSTDKINTETNLFGTTSNNKLQITFTDDDSLNSIFVTLYDKDGNQLDGTPYIAYPKKTSYSLNYVLPETEGVYQVQIDAYDENLIVNELTASDTVYHKVLGKFFVAVDSGAPEVEITSPASGSYESGTVTISGTVSKNVTPTATLTITNGDETEKPEVTISEPTYNESTALYDWTGKATVTKQGSCSLTIVATDDYGQKSSKTRQFMVDTTAPTISDEASSLTLVPLDEVSYVTLTASVSDGDDASSVAGVSVVKYYLSASEISLTQASFESGSGWTQMNQGASNYNASVAIGTFAENNSITDGKVYVYIASEDYAGNFGIVGSPLALTLDATVPEITVYEFGSASSELSDSSTSTTDSSAPLTVLVTDTNVASLTSSNSAVTVGGETSVTGGKTYSLSINWSEISSGKVEDSQSVTFTATDENERTSTTTVTLKCDNYAPRVTLDSTSEYYSSAFNLTGKVTDTNFANSSENMTVYLISTSDASSASATSATPVFTKSSDGYTWSASFTGMTEGNYNIAIVAKDSFGNASAYSTNSALIPANTIFTGSSDDVSDLGAIAITVDVNSPELGTVLVGTSSSDAASVDSSYYTNGQSDIYVKFSASDDGSGMASAYVLPYSRVTSATQTEANKATASGDSGYYEFTISASSITQSGTVYARLVDAAGNVSDVNLFALTYDATAPELQSYTIKDTTSGYTAYNSAADVYYINNKSGHAFTISGVATDNLGIASVAISAGDISETETENTSSWSFTGIDLSSVSDGGTLTITITDKAGNKETKNVTLKVDTTPPYGRHAFDAKLKDLYFRLGDADNDDITSSDSRWDSSLDKDVGGKYSNGTYGNSNTIEIRGNFTEEGSGTAYIYYQVLSSEPSESDIKTFLSDYSGKKTGYFAPLSSIETRRVFYNVTAGETETDTIGGTLYSSGSEYDKYYMTVESNFNSTISGFNEGNNYLILVAVDNVGNAEVDLVDTASFYSINVDTQVPEASGDTTDAYLTNGKVNDNSVDSDTLVISGITGRASDEDSQLSSICFTAGSGSNKVTISSSDTTYGEFTTAQTTAGSDKEWTWELKLKKAFFEKLSSSTTITINALVSDKAGSGNSQTYSVASIILDTTAPTVTLSSPTDASTDLDGVQINGTISLSGTVTDGNILTDDCGFVLQYSTDNSTFTDISGTSYSGTYSYTISDFDTTKLTDGTYYLRVAANDKAGNTGYSDSVEVKVDQNSDRPIITITTLEDSSSWLTTRTLRGTITDDDGISSFAISEDGENYTAVTVSSSAWSYTITSEDGSGKKLYFKAVDSSGNEFVTKGTTSADTGSLFHRPYYLYAGTSSSEYASYGLDNDSAITYTLDTASPLISTLALAISEDYADYDSSSNTDGIATASVIAESAAAGSTDYAISSSRYAGGDSKYIKIFVPAFDANISKVLVSISDSSTVETTSYQTVDSSTGIAAAIADSTISLTDTASTYTENSVTYTYYETKPILISGTTSGQKTVTVTVSDSAGNSTTSSASFYVDNTGPDTITVTSPSSTEEITGTTTITGTASDSGIGIDSIEWLVPPASYTDSVTDSALAAYDGWTSSNNSGTASVWKFKFTASSTTDLVQFDSTSNYKVTYDSTAQTYKIPIFFKTTDKLGNVYIDRSYYITHNPDADRPVTEFSYPTESDYDTDVSSYVTLAGTIRISGTVEVPSGTVDVGQVYVQIGTVSDNTVTWSGTNSALSNEFSTLGGVLSAEDLKSAYGTTTYVDSDWWGIAATTKTATWNISLNTNADLDPEGESTTNIAVRACAINADGKMGNWSDAYYIHVDSNAPSQSALMRQYSAFFESALDSNVSVSKDYTSEMYLKGTWYLTVTLEDNDSLDENTISVKKGSASQTYYAGDKKTTYASDETTIVSVTKNLYIPIVTTDMSSSSVSYTVYVADTAGYSSSMTYTFYIDNTAPVISTLTVNDTYSLLDESDVPVIQNSNYKTTLDGSLTESGSGCEKLFFYFLRDTVTDSSNPRVLDVMLDKDSYNGDTETDKETNYYGYEEAYTASLDTYTISQDSSISYTMYGKTYSGSLDTARTTFTADGISSNNHIRAGGLIYIGGEYQTIASISGSSVTFENAISSSITVTSAGFPYGQVVDSTDAGTWSDTTHTYASITESDGDKMVEVFKKTGTTWEWQGIFLSDYMSDGPVSVVIIAFDAAGNVSGKTIKTSVQNNAPRLAKLYLGTDLGGDGKYKTSEFNTYTFNTYTSTDASNPTANYKESVDFETAGTTYASYGKAFQVRSGLAVIPELTGGNGTIKMTFLKDASSNTTYVKSAAASGTYEVDTASLITADFSSALLTNTTTSTTDTLHKFVIPDDDLSALSDGSDKAMSFTFWDSTDGTTCGTDSNYCFVRISDITLARTDSNIPQSVIDPFAWGSSSSNNLYGASTANGHIELAKDVTTAMSNLYGSDPKVSGKITMTGYAYDDQRLSSIWIAFDGFTPSSYVTTAGDYKVTANGVAVSSGTYANSGTNGDGKTYYQAAYYTPSSESWKCAGASMASNGWEFSVSDDTGDGAYLTQSGHKVVWTLSIDTEKISTVAALDVMARVIAFDRSYNVVNVSSVTSTLSETDGSDNVPLYQMDVVPYITSMTAATAASSSGYTKRTNSIRSRLGAVPVQTSDNIVIDGFNLSTSFYRQLAANKAGTTVTDTITGTAITANESYYISAPSYSGYIIASTNGVYSLNNMNGETAYNYEQTSNSTNTYGTVSDSSLDHYFDDRYVQVWKTDYVFADSAQAISPTMEVFPSGGTYYTTDTASSTASAGKVYGSWSSDAAMFYSEVMGGSRGNPLGTTSWKDSPDDADMCIINGIPFYVILDNWQGSGYQWSTNGLFITRDGNKFTTGTAQTTTAATSANTNSTLEIQGNYYSSDPNSSDGADEMMFQFKNPKIVGTYSGNTYYTYACYFDNYAKCLKYGKITWSGTTPTAVVRTAGSHVTDGYAVVDGYDTTVTGYSDYAANVGKYSDIVLDTVNGGSAASPIPVIAYCVTNVSSGEVSLRIARGKSTSPSTSGAVVTTEGTTPTSVTRGWYYTDVTPSTSSLIPSGVQLGNYVSMAIDAGGNLHIATQDAEDGDLYYIYLTYSSSANSGYTVAACYKVDSANSVGKWNDIKLEASSGSSSVYGLKCSPIISYLDATNIENKKAVKTAFVSSSTSATEGIWEHQTAPATYAANDEKTSLVLSALDSAGTSCKLGIGYQSASFATAFLRGEN